MLFPRNVSSIYKFVHFFSYFQSGPIDGRPPGTSHNAAGFLPTDSASDLPSLLGDLADDAETDIEPFDGPDDAEDEMDTDLEELLAWGSGEIELEGMPGANPLHGHAMWCVMVNCFC